MAHVVFATVGSLGDLFPFLAVADRLRSRGHRVTVAGPPGFEASVEARGHDFHAVAVAAAGPPTDSAGKSFTEFRETIRTFVAKELVPAVTDFRDLLQGADLVAVSPYAIAAATAAEAVARPWVTVSVFPGQIPSSRTVPPANLLPALVSRPGRLVNRTWWRAYGLLMRRLWDGPLNALRRLNDLPPVEDAFIRPGLSDRLCAVLCSPHYFPRPADWPPSARLTGHVEVPDQAAAWRDPPGLAELLCGPGDLVVFTQSTVAGLDPDPFFLAAIEAATGAGRRALLLLGRPVSARLAQALREAQVPAERLLAIQYAPLSRVLPGAAAFVHHAGFGATVAAIRHGLPSVAVPRAFDQPFHAERVRALGVGRVLPWRRLTAERLKALVAGVVEDPRYRRRAADLGALLAEEDGAGRAAAEIETALAAA